MICSGHMATLELSGSRIALEHQVITTGSMQRTRGMGRGQQRDTSTDTTPPPPASLPPSSAAAAHHDTHRTSRSNSKLKVLVRSHAMREETSPPREPTPTPSINLIPSTVSSPSHSMSPVYNHVSSASSPVRQHPPCLVLSPGLSPASGNSSRCSPTTIVIGTPPSTLQQSPTGSPNRQQPVAAESSTVRTQDALNSAITRKLNTAQYSDSAPPATDANSKCKCDEKDFCAVTKTASDTNNYSSPAQASLSNQKVCAKQPTDTQRNGADGGSARARGDQQGVSGACDCPNQNCTKSHHNNNNNSSTVSNNNVSTNTLTVGRANVRHKLRHQSSSQGSYEGSSSTSPCLSRDNSVEQYTDTTGIDLTRFILETLNKNAKDRCLMLKIEQELVSLAKDKLKTHFKFPPMSSYQRMLVHRCAAYFGMDHNIEVSGKCVVVNKTKSTRIPDLRFKDHIRENLLFPEEPRRSILKRDSNSFEDCNYKSPDRQFDNRRSKSFEEREEEYEKARRRIFKDGTMQECNSQEDFNWAEMPWPINENECSKIRLLPPEQTNLKQNRLIKVQSMEGKSESSPRPCVAKSYSFGGYGGAVSVLSRGDSVTSTHSAGPRLLTKQDSSTSTISWRLSPSSSGYKSQSQRSDSVTPSPTATPHQLSDASGKNSLEGADPITNSITEETVEQTQQMDKCTDTCDDGPDNTITITSNNNNNNTSTNANQLVWAVTDMQSVPKGSVLINPQTGQPFTNLDGSIYHFDPLNPPLGMINTSKPPPSPPKASTPHKSPVKERSLSPKKSKSRTSPLKNKSCLINSSTSPSLPVTPPVQQNHTVNYQPAGTSMESVSNVPVQHYPVYPNGYVQQNMPGSEGPVPVYQPPMNMVYTPYGVPPQYDNRPETAISDLPGYFINMTVAEPPCGSQSVGYQPPTGTYWGQQPMTYYQPPAGQQQRYPVPVPVPNQAQGYAPAHFPPNYVPVTPNTPTVPTSSELLPLYSNPPVQMVYPTQQTNPNPIFIQNPNQMIYPQNPIFPPNTMYPAYPTSTATPNSVTNTYTAPNFGPSTTPNHCYNQTGQNYLHNNVPSYENRGPQRNLSKNKCTTPKCGQNYQQNQQHSNQNSGGSNSPANTVIAGYFPNAGGSLGYRHCTPPDTPPNQNIGYGFPPNYMQHSVIFRPLGGVRASPPMNLRSSRSPTPAPEYPPTGPTDRSQRYSVGPTVYHGVPCILPGDMRLIGGRSQAAAYRQPYRQQPALSQQSATPDHFSNRSHKVRKQRTKVPALPPSGRQSNQSVSAHTQQRF